jgi:hypothetical protein
MTRRDHAAITFANTILGRYIGTGGYSEGFVAETAVLLADALETCLGGDTLPCGDGLEPRLTGQVTPAGDPR